MLDVKITNARTVIFNMRRIVASLPRAEGKFIGGMAKSVARKARRNISLRSGFQNTGWLESKVRSRKTKKHQWAVEVDAKKDGYDIARIVERGSRREFRQKFRPGSIGDKLSMGWRTMRGEPYVPRSTRIHPKIRKMNFLKDAVLDTNKEIRKHKKEWDRVLVRANRG